MFLLAFIGAYSAKAPPRVLTIVSGALSAAAVVGTVLYVFAQNWLQSLVFMISVAELDEWKYSHSY